MELKGKVALVTGGGRGLGEGIAKKLAEAGCDVAVADIDLDNAKKVAADIKDMGRKAVAIKVDVTKWEQVKSMVDKTIKELGSLDIAVNNAGVISIKSVEDLSEDDWDHVLDVNAKGVFLCAKAEIPHMKKQNWGRIINTASIAGKAGFPDLAHYSASKFAVVGFTNALAKELAPSTKITVNAICPGIIGTQMWYGDKGLANKWKGENESMDESWQRNQESLIPQGEAQTAEDMGDLAVYFATAPHVTGQAVAVDGGMTL
ncbi:SDR family NAD(P)-dependent oxidoreductase [Halanaerobium hydrogeniformans]|uniref:Short-chain dehydrogenase/reductase SDR n=1 Tax=Halanaerobium hydrogeniformans TaxID=656519 RepID=E4RM41_HALHG|nr:SDR family NAD(P)-dependent oxidoreductase [Halanaerobium hydrogeniformans]ADQ14372.1 short-chain dehydrogenase/reductase SDR [Halanaerobium hydrogeniformans]